MDWETFASAARAVSGEAYVATSRDGQPHVAAVYPGYTDGTIWFATRASSGKFRNLLVNPMAAFHWAIGTGTGPGELFARGTATLHTDLDDRVRLWSAGILPYDPEHFFGSADNPDLAFVETTVTSASILGPDFSRTFYRP